MGIAIALAVALGLQAASIVAGDTSTVDAIPVTLSEKLVRYEVKGDTSHELFDHMKKVGPLDDKSAKRYQGLTVWAARWTFDTGRQADGRCGLEHVKVELEVLMTLPEWQYPDPSTTRRFVARMLDGLRREPAVNGAAVVNVLPSTNINQTFALEVQGRSAPREEPDYVDDRVVSPANFETMRIRILKGRAFTELDADRAAPVAIVSASMAA